MSLNQVFKPKNLCKMHIKIEVTVRRVVKDKLKKLGFMRLSEFRKRLILKNRQLRNGKCLWC